MNENSTHTDLLIQYLDGELRGEQLLAIQKEIDENPDSRNEVESLRMAKEAARSYALKTRIGQLHGNMMGELHEKPKGERSVVREISRYVLRAAAVILILLGVSGIYQYVTATPDKLFIDKFHEFNLHETRGSGRSELEDSYQKGEMKETIRQFNGLEKPAPVDYFLAGNAYLSIRQPVHAIEALNSLIQLNLTAGTHFFEEDAEYYLALGYLDNEEPEKALPLLEKIHNDPDHPYHSLVSAWFLQKVKKTVKA